MNNKIILVGIKTLYRCIMLYRLKYIKDVPGGIYAYVIEQTYIRAFVSRPFQVDDDDECKDIPVSFMLL